MLLLSLGSGPDVTTSHCQVEFEQIVQTREIICLEAALHFSPIIPLISEVVHAPRWAKGPMIHMKVKVK